MGNFDPYANATPIDGREMDLGGGRAVALYRFDIGVELRFTRVEVGEDAGVPEYTEGVGQPEFRLDGKVVTRVMLSREAATAAFMLLGWVADADIMADDVILRERERCAKVAEGYLLAPGCDCSNSCGPAIALRLRIGE